MRLYLIRHGKALDGLDDAARQLAKKGMADVEAVGTLLAGLGLDLPEIWHSGRVRARQTAEILAPHIAPHGRVMQHAGVDSEDPVAPIADLLRAREDDLAIAGHQPFMGDLAGLLLTGSERSEPVLFKTGSIACLGHLPEGAWTLCWMITPKVARRT
jgi:phosphohistidine phosphatase